LLDRAPRAQVFVSSGGGHIAADFVGEHRAAPSAADVLAYAGADAAGLGELGAPGDPWLQRRTGIRKRWETVHKPMCVAALSAQIDALAAQAAAQAGPGVGQAADGAHAGLWRREAIAAADESGASAAGVPSFPGAGFGALEDRGGGSRGERRSAALDELGAAAACGAPGAGAEQQGFGEGARGAQRKAALDALGAAAGHARARVLLAPGRGGVTARECSWRDAWLASLAQREPPA